MINKSNMAETKEKYEEFWALENHDRPLLYVTAPKDKQTEFHYKIPKEEKDRWMNTDYQIAKARAKMHNTFYGGESYPYISPDLGPDILGAMVGCNLEFGPDTTWAVHTVNNWDKLPPLKLDLQNYWLKALDALVTAFVEDASNGDYLVGIPDFHPGLDGLTSLRGPQELCFDLYDDPDTIQERQHQLFQVYQQVFDYFYKKTSKYQEGTTHWMNPWHPKKWYNISCDFMCMLSSDMVAEFVLNEVKKETQLFDACMFHLDGPGAANHIDALLQIEQINGIQWQYGAGNQTAAHWIPLMQKIQDAGKTLIVDVVPEDIAPLLAHLKPEGFMMNAYCKNETQALSVLQEVNQFYKKEYIHIPY